jgi:hypothetical protein
MAIIPARVTTFWRNHKWQIIAGLVALILFVLFLWPGWLRRKCDCTEAVNTATAAATQPLRTQLQSTQTSLRDKQGQVQALQAENDSLRAEIDTLTTRIAVVPDNATAADSTQVLDTDSVVSDTTINVRSRDDWRTVLAIPAGHCALVTVVDSTDTWQPISGVAADDSIVTAKGGSLTPNQFDVVIAEPTKATRYPAPDLPFGSLLARIGNDGEIMATGYASRICTEGNLNLGQNRMSRTGRYTNGELQVRIRILLPAGTV